MSQKVFITFGNNKYLGAVKRICSQAQKIGCFDKIIGYTEEDLKKDELFWNQHANFINNNRRGYGYWIWKFYLVHKTLLSMNEDDILVYADAGCEINVDGLPRLQEYFEIVKESETANLAFELPFPEKEYTKSDTINYFKAESISSTKQLMATTCVIRKCDFTLKMVQEAYFKTCNYKIVDDSPSLIENHPIFKDHRHDQSIFSIIRKQMGCVIIPDETYFEPDWKTKGKKFPIWAMRNSTENSRI